MASTLPTSPSGGRSIIFSRSSAMEAGLRLSAGANLKETVEARSAWGLVSSARSIVPSSLPIDSNSHRSSESRRSDSTSLLKSRNMKTPS